MTTIQFEETMDGLVIDRISRDHDFNMLTKHFHNEYEIYYLISGDRYYFIDTQTYYCPAGSLVLIERNLVHKTSMVQVPYHDRILLELQGELLDSFMMQLGFKTKDFFHQYTGVYHLPQEKQQGIEKLLLSIANEIRFKSLNYEFLVSLKLMELMVFVMRFDSTQKASQISEKARTEKHDLVEKVATYLSDAYADNESLEEIARKFFVNKCYLSRIYKEVTGFTISEYKNINRIRRARVLLDETDTSISDIAKTLGFQGCAYFVKVFKTYTETTPYHYRKQMQTYKAQQTNHITE